MPDTRQQPPCPTLPAIMGSSRSGAGRCLVVESTKAHVRGQGNVRAARSNECSSSGRYRKNATNTGSIPALIAHLHQSSTSTESSKWEAKRDVRALFIRVIPPPSDSLLRAVTIVHSAGSRYSPSARSSTSCRHAFCTIVGARFSSSKNKIPAPDVGKNAGGFHRVTPSFTLGNPRKSTGSSRMARTSITGSPRRCPHCLTMSDFPIPGEPHIATGIRADT